jgi:hypothetical protein
MELREPETLGVLDDHERRVRHVDADLDHGGRNEQLDAAGLEVLHDACLFGGREPAVHQPHREFRQLGREPRVRVDRGLQVDRPDSSISGHTQYAWRPSPHASRMRRTTSSRRLPATSLVMTGFRPGGSSSITDTSRSA